MRFRAFLFLLLISLFNMSRLRAQSDTAAEFKPHGTFWGLTFGDFAFKGNADTVGNGLGTRGSNQWW